MGPSKRSTGTEDDIAITREAAAPLHGTSLPTAALPDAPLPNAPVPAAPPTAPRPRGASAPLT